MYLGPLGGRDLSIPSTSTFPEVCDTTEDDCYGKVFREERHGKTALEELRGIITIRGCIVIYARFTSYRRYKAIACLEF